MFGQEVRRVTGRRTLMKKAFPADSLQEFAPKNTPPQFVLTLNDALS